MGVQVPGALGVALCRARRAQVAAVVPCRERGRDGGGTLPWLARAGVETPPSPVGVGPSSSLREPASRPSWLVGPGGGMVLRLLSRHRNPIRWFPPSRIAGSRASSPCLVGIQVGVRGRPQPAPSSPLPHR